MTKSLFGLLALITTLSLTGCQETETALIEDGPEPQTENTSTEQVDSGESIAITPEPTKPSTKTQPMAQSEPNVALASLQKPFSVKKCMNLGNALEAENEGDWGYRIRARDFQILARAGFDTVRIPVRWDPHTGHRPPYEIDSRFMSRVKTVVTQAQSAGLGVIIDVHHFEGLMSNTRRQEARFLVIWNQIAIAFKDAPDNVYFEVLNEPTREISMSKLNALYAKIIPLIRASNPSRKIILGGNSWNSVDTLKLVEWPMDDNLIATFHDYGPHAFTHQGAEWSEPVMPLGRKWGGDGDMDELRETYDLANSFKARTGLPVFVGEFGVIDKVPQAERNQWTKTRRQAMEASGMSWCAWDFSGAFKSYDIANEQWIPGVLDALFSR